MGRHGSTERLDGAAPSRSEQLLEGNEVQRRKIRAWLDEWQNGTPKKKAILLIGPRVLVKQRLHEPSLRTWGGTSLN